MKTLRDLLTEQLKDLYSAEKQLIEALPEMAKAARSSGLKKAFQNHLEETKGQAKRLEKCSTLIDEKLNGHTCKAMKGLIQEGKEALEESYSEDALRDVMLVSAAQRVEHYEIAGYGNAIALAQYLGLDEVAELLQETIEQEGEADKLLTALCEQELFDECTDEDEPYAANL